MALKVQTADTRAALTALQEAIAAATPEALGDLELWEVFDAVIIGGLEGFNTALGILDEGYLIRGYEGLRGGWARLVEGTEILLTELVQQGGTSAKIHFPRMRVAALPEVDAVGRCLQTLADAMDTLIVQIVTPAEGWTPGERYWIETVITGDNRPRFRPWSYRPVTVTSIPTIPPPD